MQTSILQLQLMGITFLINEERWFEHDIDPVSTIQQKGEKGFIKDKGREKNHDGIRNTQRRTTSRTKFEAKVRRLHIFPFSSIFLFSFLLSLSLFLTVYFISSFIHSFSLLRFVHFYFPSGCMYCHGLKDLSSILKFSSNVLICQCIRRQKINQNRLFNCL